jgi:hypothetical protein
VRFVVFDTESDGFAYEATKLHVLGFTYDGVNFETTNDYRVMRDFFNQEGVKYIGHNSVRHDLPLINRILGLNLQYLDFVDTLPLSWTINYQRDKHGLESYGETFGVPKPKVEDWNNLSYEEYAHRVSEDVKINWLLWKDLERKLGVLYGWDE